LDEYGISLNLIPELKKGYDVIDEKTGSRILNSELTTDPLRPRAYAYCCDTAFNKDILKQIQNVDLMYHDSTFDEKSKSRAEETFHSTAKQAAEMAKLANARQLMIGHFSSKYENLYVLLDEAKEIFKNSLIAIEGKTVEIER
jgi:ribonuclease Z